MKVRAGTTSTAGLFAGGAALSLAAVLVLGAFLAASYRHEARARGVAEGRSQAALVAQTAIEPLLDGRPLAAGLNAAERGDLARLVAQATSQHSIVRLRMRSLAGNVVYSDDGSGIGGEIEDEVLDAAHGKVVTALTRLNSDTNDAGPRGEATVEVYMPLVAGPGHARVGVLEIYLPYASIRDDIASGLHN